MLKTEILKPESNMYKNKTVVSPGSRPNKNKGFGTDTNDKLQGCDNTPTLTLVFPCSRNLSLIDKYYTVWFQEFLDQETLSHCQVLYCLVPGTDLSVIR